MDLPFITDQIPGIGGKIKSCPEDFEVEEILSYSCSGQGEFIYVKIKKYNLPTFTVKRLLAQNLKIAEREIGYAGIKDTHAVSIQHFSLPRAVLTDLEQLEIPGVEVLGQEIHHKKLKIGHLKENRFRICIRDFQKEREQNIEQIVDLLKAKGIPNYFGEQRFGVHSNTGILGKALLFKDYELFVQTLLGEIKDLDAPIVKEAKTLFLQGKYLEAEKCLPRYFGAEKTLLVALAAGKNLKKAIMRISRQMRYFYISAYQSMLFNQILALRLPFVNELWEGDIAMLYPRRSVFYVQDLEVENRRCHEFEISPTGPLFGYKMMQPQGKQGEIEQQIFADENLSAEIFRERRIKGERRSLRFAAENFSWQTSSAGVELGFTLPKGCYATVLLREIMKAEMKI